MIDFREGARLLQNLPTGKDGLPRIVSLHHAGDVGILATDVSDTSGGDFHANILLGDALICTRGINALVHVGDAKAKLAPRPSAEKPFPLYLAFWNLPPKSIGDDITEVGFSDTSINGKPLMHWRFYLLDLAHLQGLPTMQLMTNVAAPTYSEPMFFTGYMQVEEARDLYLDMSTKGREPMGQQEDLGAIWVNGKYVAAWSTAGPGKILVPTNFWKRGPNVVNVLDLRAYPQVFSLGVSANVNP